ncbi:MAG: hypothetical protein PUP92_32755 [Rhizonema sp. PD38]|nr:hypothetical protein [Rhizonema sp. PD38]
MKQQPNPTVEQMTEMFRICTSLTNMFISIHLIRVDERSGDLIIVAGEEIQAAINKQGEVDYSD